MWTPAYIGGKEMPVTKTNTKTGESIGWSDKSKDDPQVLELKTHLEANSGIEGLQVLGPNDVEREISVQILERLDDFQRPQ